MDVITMILIVFVAALFFALAGIVVWVNSKRRYAAESIDRLIEDINKEDVEREETLRYLKLIRNNVTVWGESERRPKTGRPKSAQRRGPERNSERR